MHETVIERLESWDFTKEFVVDVLGGGTSYSYESFFGRCLLLSENFSSYGKDRTHLALVMENSVELLACYFGALMCGKVASAIDPLKGEEEICKILEGINDPIVITDEIGSKKLNSFDMKMEPGYFLSLEPLAKAKENTIQLFTNRNFDDDYLLTFTSGTSGNTKGVRHTLNNLFKTAEAFNAMFDLGADSRFAHLMPMTYMAGILNSIFQPFVCGASIVVLGRFSPIRAFSFWQLTAQYKINTFWLSPSMLTIILKVGNHKVGQEYCAAHQLHLFIGTAPLHLTTRQEFEKMYSAKLYASYGLSETLYLSVETPETLLLGGGNVGKLLKGVQYKFGADGEFLVDVPWMFLGYTNEHTPDYFADNYYKTGDLAKIEDGILSIVGRSKDLIIKGGMNISPALIEGVVASVAGVEECSVFSVLSKQKEELIVLGYASAENAAEVEKLVSTTVAQKLGKNYLIDLFYKVPAIPKNINGKNDKKALKESYLKSGFNNVG